MRLNIEATSESSLSQKEVCDNVRETLLCLVSEKIRSECNKQSNRLEEKNIDDEYSIYGKPQNSMWLQLFAGSTREDIETYEQVTISLYDEYDTPSVREKPPEKSILTINFLEENKLQIKMQDKKEAKSLAKYLRKYHQCTLLNLLENALVNSTQDKTVSTPRKFSFSDLSLFSGSPKKEQIIFSPRTPKNQSLQKVQTDIISENKNQEIKKEEIKDIEQNGYLSSKIYRP